jgi:hypothetical protein
VTNLILMAAFAVAALALWLLRKHRLAVAHPLAFSLAWIMTYAWTLLLGLRFSARVDPGFWDRNAVVNYLINFGGVYVVGYMLVLTAALLNVTAVLMRRAIPSQTALIKSASLVRNACVAIVCLTIARGFWLAFALERLPAG